LAFTLIAGTAVSVPVSAPGEEVVGPIDACALLSTPEVERTLKRVVEAPEHSDVGYVDSGAYSSTCVWRLPQKPAAGGRGPRSIQEKAKVAEDEHVDGSAQEPSTAPMGGRHFVILHAMRWPSGMAHTFLDDFYAAAERGELPHEPIAREIGDDGLWWGDGVASRKGDVSFGVSVFVEGLDSEQSQRLDESLARQVLRRLVSGKH
jgi:hypothetical protein